MLRTALLPLVDLIYPPRCPACGDVLAAQNGLCSACWTALERPEGVLCALCSMPLRDESLGERALCAPCLAEPPRHSGIAAATLYCPIARRLVLKFKYGRQIGLTPLLSQMISAALPQCDGEWAVVPVPLHWSRMWRRGYNQSALLAADIAKRQGHELVVDGLVRRKKTPPLGGLGRKERAKTLSGAIVPNPRRTAAIKGKRVLLIDDVLTSGATTNACVKALQKAGVKKVVIACFSRVAE